MARKVKTEEAVTLSSSIADQIAAANNDQPAVDDAVTVAQPVDDAIVVEDDIAIPTGRAARQSKYNWDINVGQSYFLSEAGVDQTKYVARIQQACHQRNAKGDGKKFIVRKWTGPNGQLGARIWRTA